MFAAGKTAGASSGSTIDAQFNYVTMLLHGDGTNGAQNNTFLDSSTNNSSITRNGNTTQGSFAPYGLNWSNFFNGSAQLSFSTNSGYAFGTGDFTVECWYFATSNPGYRSLIETRASNGTNNGWALAADSGGTMYVYANGFILTGITVVLNTWNHVAFTRSGSTQRLFLNGAVVSSTTTARTYSDTNLGIGGVAYTTGEYWTGNISNVRLIKGTCLYTTTFTPSTTPLTAVSGTTMLTCQSNRFIDNSTTNATITVGSGVSVEPFNPFGASTAYSTSVIGGSGYFDGGGDYLAIAGNASQDIGSSDFTYECFWYPVSLGSSRQALVCSTTDYWWGIDWQTGGKGLGLWASSTGSSWNMINADGGGNGITSVSPISNSWNHIAVSRTGGTWSMWLNGTRILNLTGITGTVVSRSSEAKRIGVWAASYGFDLYGYITDSRLVVGSYVYNPTSTTITVPTAPLTAITNTKWLLSTTNGAIFDNAMMNDLETVGNAQISTSVYKYGTGSLYFDGNGDNLSGPANPNLDMNTGNWTIECWVYISSRTLNYPLIFGNNNGGYSTGALAITNSNADSASYNDKFFLAFYDVGTFVASGPTNSLNTWYHLAVVRNGTNLSMYRNGSSVISTTISAGITFNWGKLGSRVGGGNWDGAQSYFNGYIDDLRVTKGYARYTANFTPPTAAFPNTGPN